MCGRFDFNPSYSRELLQIQKAMQNPAEVQVGEVFPTQRVPVLVDLLEASRPVPMYWGFPRFKGNGIIINARSETVLEKPMFQACALTRRCVIPTSGFYEWDRYHGAKDRPKYKFTLPSSEVLYLAGVYSAFPQRAPENPRFVLLTTSSNEWIEDIHHRMPVVLTAEELELWFQDATFTTLFSRSNLTLIREQVGFPIQLSLFD